MIKMINDAEFGQLRVNDFDGALPSESHPNPMISDSIDTAVFFARQLESIKSQSYDVKYANLKFRTIFAVSNEVPEGMKSITYETFDGFAIAKWAGSYGRDMPRADIGGKETTIPVRDAHISYGFTTSEIRSAAITGMPLSSRKASMAVRGNEELFNDVAFFGDADVGLVGLFTHPNIPVTVAPDGASTGPEWATKTPDEILLDLNNAVNDVNINTLLVEEVNTLLLNPANRALIATTARSPNSDTTILQYFVQNNEFISGVESVIACNECKASIQADKGLGNFNVMVAFNNSADSMVVEIPMELKFLAEQHVGMEILVPGEASTGGLNVFYPLSANIVTNI